MVITFKESFINFVTLYHVQHICIRVKLIFENQGGTEIPTNRTKKKVNDQ